MVRSAEVKQQISWKFPGNVLKKLPATPWLLVRNGRISLKNIGGNF